LELFRPILALNRHLSIALFVTYFFLALPITAVAGGGPVVFAYSDVARTRKNTSIDIAVLANDPLVNSSPIVTSVTVPLHGTASINPNNTVRYTPAAGYVGVDTFSYTSRDSANRTGSAVVTVVTQTPFTFHGCGFSPYVDGQSPDTGGTVTSAQLRNRLNLISPYCEWIRFYGTSSDLLNGPRLASQLGHKVACGAWIGTSATENQTQITNLISIARYCDTLIVGNEVLLRGDQTPTALIAYMNQVKAAVPFKPVTTADVDWALINNPNVIAASDVVYTNIHPWWQGFPVAGAVSKLYEDYLNLQSVAQGKEVVIAETGWRSFGGNTVRAFAIGLRARRCMSFLMSTRL
jgi:exo-beta-1,3-glucanase (GH17 family)